MGAETIRRRPGSETQRPPNPPSLHELTSPTAFIVQLRRRSGAKLTRQGAEPVPEMWEWLTAIVSAAVVVWRGYVWWKKVGTRITVGPVSESWVAQHRGRNLPYR
jgi:hypothetical protein